MDLNWIITANAGKARFFAEATPTSRLQEFTDMVNPAARSQPKTMPAEHEAGLFANNIAGYLLQAWQEKRFEHLIVTASPEFLGVLRQCLDPQLHEVLSLSIDKDYTQHGADQLHGVLDADGRAGRGSTAQPRAG